MRLQQAWIVVIASASSTVSHVLVTDAFGNADPSIKGYGIGHDPKVRRGAADELDVAVFSKPTVVNRNCKKCPIYDDECTACRGIPNCQKCPLGYDYNCAQCRTRNIATCGRTPYVTQSKKYYIHDAPESRGSVTNAVPLWGTAALNTPAWVEWMLHSKLVPKVTAGGWLNVTMSQANTDGGGPYTCEIDESGTGTQFKPLQISGTDIAGRYGANLCKAQDWYVGAILPKTLNCRGTNSYGNSQKICMIRCKNDAPNGPFGGCITVQQVDGPGAEFPELGKQNFCKNGKVDRDLSDAGVRFLAGNYRIKIADIEYLLSEVGEKRKTD